MALAPAWLAIPDRDPGGTESGVQDTYRVDWPTFQHNPSRTNAWPSAGSTNISAYQPLWVSSTKYPFSGTPAIADLDGDGRQEIVAANNDRILRSFYHNGTIHWKPKVTYFPQWISAGQLDRLDGPDVLVSGIAALDSRGRLLWEYPPVSDGFKHDRPAILYDLDDDGNVEVITGTSGGSIRDRTTPFSIEVLSGASGTLLLKNLTRHHVYAPAVGDVDGDGVAEIVVGTVRQSLLYTDSDGTYRDFPAEGEVIALKRNPLLGGLGVASFRWDWTFRFVGGEWGVQRPPAIVDLDGDGEMEIVVLTGSDYIIVILTPEGTVKGALPWKPDWRDKQFAVADLDNDGQLEIVFTELNITYAYNFNGGRFVQRWRADFHEPIRGLAAADLDGDQKPELVVTSGFDWHNPKYLARPEVARTDLPMPAEEATVWVLRHDGAVLWKSPRSTSLLGHVALGDLEVDGTVEIVALGRIGRLYVFGANGHQTGASLSTMEAEADRAADAVCRPWAHRCELPQPQPKDPWVETSARDPDQDKADPTPSGPSLVEDPRERSERTTFRTDQPDDAEEETPPAKDRLSGPPVWLVAGALGLASWFSVKSPSRR